MLILDIQYFADEGASAETGDIGAVTTDTGVESAADSNSEVQYGIQNDTPSASPEPVATDKRQTLKEMLKADAQLKAEYDAEISKVVKRRLKASEEPTNAFNTLKPTLSVLAQYYGKEATDYAGIAESIKGDNTYFKKQALNEGKTAEEVKDHFWLDQKNQELERQMDQIRRDREKEKLFSKWNTEIPEISRLYPDFDLDSEMENDDFARLAVSDGLRKAYEFVHLDEITARLTQYAQNKGAEAVYNSIAANKARPSEGGLSPKANPQQKIDASELTSKDIKEIRRQVKAGKIISF